MPNVTIRLVFQIRSHTYVDGISITLGSSWQHIWTCSVSYQGDEVCLCAPTPGSNPSVFIESNYYCESGINVHPDGKHSTCSIHYGMDGTVHLTVDVVHNWECLGSIGGHLCLWVKILKYKCANSGTWEWRHSHVLKTWNILHVHAKSSFEEEKLMWILWCVGQIGQMQNFSPNILH